MWKTESYNEQLLLQKKHNYTTEFNRRKVCNFSSGRGAYRRSGVSNGYRNGENQYNYNPQRNQYQSTNSPSTEFKSGQLQQPTGIQRSEWASNKNQRSQKKEEPCRRSKLGSTAFM